MLQIFTKQSPYKKRARLLAILWTLLIFILCLWPGDKLPTVNVPLFDKWVHFAFFGGFSFLWLCANPTKKPSYLLFIFLAAVFVGCLIEELQGYFTSLKRSKDIIDAIADSIGGLIGVLCFYFGYIIAERSISKNPL